MRRRWLALLLLLTACGAAPEPAPVTEPSMQGVSSGPPSEPPPATPHDEPAAIAYVDSDHQAIADSEARAAPGGRRVLETAGTMIDDDVVMVGSCWDWAEAVFTRAGGHPHQVFHARQERGPWADPALFQPGDWLYFLHTDSGGPHSAIFVAWLDEPHHVGLTASYAGGHVDEPARYGSYELTQVFRVVRMDD